MNSSTLEGNKYTTFSNTPMLYNTSFKQCDTKGICRVFDVANSAMLGEKVANVIPIHESSETKYLQFDLQQYMTLASRHILYVENYVAKCLSVWFFWNNMLQIFTKLEPVKLNSECKPVRCESVANRSRRREGIRVRVWQMGSKRR